MLQLGRSTVKQNCYKLNTCLTVLLPNCDLTNTTGMYHLIVVNNVLYYTFLFHLVQSGLIKAATSSSF